MQAEPSNSYDPVRDLRQKAAEMGWEAAKTTGDTEYDPVREDIATAYLTAAVQATYAGALDTGRSQGDAEIQQTYSQAAERSRRTDTTADQAKRKWHNERDAVPALEDPPRPSIFVIVSAIIALAFTFAMSLSGLPLIEQIDDAEMRLILSAVMGLAVAATAISSMYRLAPHDPDAPVVKPLPSSNGWLLVASLTMGIGFAAIRLATSGDDLLLTTGLAALDLGVLLYGKFDATQYRNKIAVYAERLDARAQKQSLAENALAEFREAENAALQAQGDFRAARQRRDDRLKHNFDLESVTQVVCARWREAYAAGLDKNREPRASSRPAAAWSNGVAAH